MTERQGQKSPCLFGPLSIVGQFLGVDEGDAQGGGDLGQVLGTEGGAVVHLELAGKSPFQEGLAESIQVVVQPFGEIKLGMGNEAAVVIQGKEEGLSLPPPFQDRRAVHGIGLP
jgi:hypothetical protein